MADDRLLEHRIRERAYQIWLDEGCPSGRAQEHWDLAKLAIAQQDGLGAALLSPEESIPRPEPIEAVTNQAEFPTLVDQGEGLSPAEWGKPGRSL
jgi:hypothetical protein